MAMYTQDYDEAYPAAAMGGATATESKRWYDVVNPYVKSKQQVWVCPSAGPLARYGGSDGYTTGGYAYNVGGSAVQRDPFTGVANVRLGNGFGLNGGQYTPTDNPVKLALISIPAETVMAADPSGILYSEFNYRAEFLYTWSNIAYLPMLHGGPFDKSSAALIANPDGGGNYLYADGHVKYHQVTYMNANRRLFNVVK
jgi:prepilin-type processing-associated H-X9-DG protein